MKKIFANTTINYRLGQRRFTCTLSISVIMGSFLIFLLLVGLGFWQLARGEEKRTLITAYEKNQTQPALHFNLGSDRLPLHKEFTLLRVTGQFVNQHSLLIERTSHDVRGYEVLTPLVTQQQVLLVNRGWVAADHNRRKLPYMPPIDGEITLEGYAKFLTNKGLTLAKPDTTHFPIVLQQLTLNTAKSLYPEPVEPFILLL